MDINYKVKTIHLPIGVHYWTRDIHEYVELHNEFQRWYRGNIKELKDELQYEISKKINLCDFRKEFQNIEIKSINSKQDIYFEEGGLIETIKMAFKIGFIGAGAAIGEMIGGVGGAFGGTALGELFSIISDKTIDFIDRKWQKHISKKRNHSKERLEKIKIEKK